MSPTPHLRFAERYEWDTKAGPRGDGDLVKRRILQQLWREHHVPAGETQPKEEWRDVAVVEEGEVK